MSKIYIKLKALVSRLIVFVWSLGEKEDDEDYNYPMY